MHFRVIAIALSRNRYRTIASSCYCFVVPFHYRHHIVVAPSHRRHIALSKHSFIVVPLRFALLHHHIYDTNLDSTMMRLWTTWPYAHFIQITIVELWPKSFSRRLLESFIDWRLTKNDRVAVYIYIVSTDWSNHRTFLLGILIINYWSETNTRTSERLNTLHFNQEVKSFTQHSYCANARVLIARYCNLISYKIFT